MTERQKSYITSLVSGRVLDDSAKATVAREVAEGSDAPTNAQASALIDWLLTLPRAAQLRAEEDAWYEARGTSPAVDVPAGRYALVNDDGVVKFYAVDRPDEGRWAGYVFVNALGSEERYPIRDRNAKAAVLAGIAADVEEARIRYGLELGRCGFCGRALTDEVSRAAAIGPDCAERHGIDRSVYAERAAAMAAARVRGDVRSDGEDDGLYNHYAAATQAAA